MSGRKPKEKSVKTVNEWLDRDDLEQGYTIANAKFLREYSYCSKELGRYALLLYLLLSELNIKYVRAMMHSAKIQAEFCRAVCAKLREKKVDPIHAKVFEKDIKSVKSRLETIERITKEDVHLTEFEPFAIAVMYDNMNDTDFDYEEISEMAKEWNDRHKDIVAEHMEKIKPELERHEQYMQRVRDDIKAEKEERKARKKAEDAYVKELRENAKKNKSDYKKQERSFQRYYEGRY